MRRKIGLYIIFLLFCMLCIFSCQTASREEVETVTTLKSGKKQDVKIYESADMDISINYGFCGLIQKDESLPVEVTFLAERDWAGVIKISVPISADKEASYEQKVNIKKGESTRKISIPSIENAYYFNICIEDESNNKLVTTKVETGITRENKLYMGVLSEEEESLSYFDGLKKQKGEDEAKVVQIKLEASEIPDNAEEFSALDYLLINQFSANALSQKQREAIQTWVEQGGVVIIGTGGESTDTLNQLWNVVAKSKNKKKEKVLLSLDWAGAKENIILDHISVEVKDGVEYDSLLNRELLKKISYGEGFFCISEIDLADPLIEKYKEKIGQIILEQTTTKRFYLLMGDKGESVQSLTKALNFSHGDTMPNIFIYISLFLVYIGLIGPTAYFILKHFDRKAWFFTVILFLSCLFTAFVFGVSSDYKKKKPTASILVVVNGEKDDETVYISTQSLERKEYHLNLPSETKSVEVVPDLDALYNASDLYEFGEKETEYIIEKEKETFTVDFLKRPILEQNILKLMREKGKNIGRFQYKLNFNADSISGRLENQTSYDFSYVLFYYQKRYWIYKDLKKNQTAKIKNGDINLLDLTQNEREYFLSESVYPIETKNEYIEMNDAQKILGFLYENILKEDEEDKERGYFIGITSEMEDAILKDEDLDVKQKLVYIQPVSKADVDGNMGMEILDLYLQKVDGELYGGVLYSKSVTISYQIENSDEVGGLTRLNDYYDGKIYAYDYKKQKYERVLKDSQDKITEDEVRNYIDDEGNLQILLKTEVDYTQLPVIAITERE